MGCLCLGNFSVSGVTRLSDTAQNADQYRHHFLATGWSTMSGALV
ncbi:MAG: hypothetical protein ACLRZN_07270 [Dialister invisus]